jgi:penicillin-binding protein 1A
VLAMVGGRDFSANQFNLAVQGRRQPGSAFKPFVLATALQQGVRPGTKFSAAPYSVRVKDGVWNVENYENKITAGRLTLNAATDWSVNAVYARLIMLIGPKNVVTTAKKMGITTTLDPDPAIALGGLRIGVSPLEMASAYGAIANRGLAVPPSGVLRVLDSQGEVIYEPKRTAKRAIDRATAMQESLMLHNVVQKGTGVQARIGRWAAGKTGTTQSYRDAWFVGWSGDISTAVWVGHRDGQVAMTNVHGTKVTGGSFPAAIWAAFMKPAGSVHSETVANIDEPLPSTQAQVLSRVCEDSMRLANSRCPRTIDIYLDPALVPKQICALH